MAQAVANSATSTQVQGHRLMLLTCRHEVPLISLSSDIITAAITSAAATTIYGKSYNRCCVVWHLILISQFVSKWKSVFITLGINSQSMKIFLFWLK